MAYYYETTHQNVIKCSSVDWKHLREFRSNPIGRTCLHYSAVTDDKLATLTSLVKIWTPQQRMHYVLWFTKFKSITRVQRRVRTEWNGIEFHPPVGKNCKGDGNFGISNWRISLSVLYRRQC
ncbi:uncharacterized protein TNCV_1349111 [Trichonephila clavipes]|nr:uncharacterized protein TNCV_1349111 [Trichonephila clavipes]